MIWITGDAHGSFGWLERFCREKSTTRADVMIILGDACINYFGPGRDDVLKGLLAALPVTLLCLHGNHEMRPQRLPGYGLTPWRGGLVWREERFPSLLFAHDGEVYDLEGVSTMVIGGAFSVDKSWRIARGWGWWPDEQPDEPTRARVEAALEARGWRVGAVLSHTCPLKYEPAEVFLDGVDQRRVDKSTELWLDAIDDRLHCPRWFCGHFHTDKELAPSPEQRVRFMMHAVLEWRTANGLAEETPWLRAT